MADASSKTTGLPVTFITDTNYKSAMPYPTSATARMPVTIIADTLNNSATALTAAGSNWMPDFRYAYETVTSDGSLSFPAALNLSPVTSTAIFINTSTSSRALTFNGSWIFVGNAAPSTLAANKTAVLSLTCDGSNQSNVYAAWAAQP